MRVILTGRVLDWFVKDITAVRARGGKPLVGPVGTYVVTPPVGPMLWHFPQPLHWVEAVASMRGFGPTWADPAAEAGALGRMREGDWVKYTDVMAEKLFVSGPTVRYVWHLLTPLNAGAGPVDLYPDLFDTEETLWRAATDRTRPPLFGVTQKRPRDQFWTEDLFGDIEL